MLEKNLASHALVIFLKLRLLVKSWLYDMSFELCTESNCIVIELKFRIESR